MPDTLSPPVPATAATKLDPKIVAGAILVGLSLGVVVGMKLAKMMAPPQLPPRRLPCSECEERKVQVHTAAPVVAPPIVAPPPPVVPDSPAPPPATFSPQAVADDDA